MMEAYMRIKNSELISPSLMNYFKLDESYWLAGVVAHTVNRIKSNRFLFSQNFQLGIKYY